MSNVIQKNLIGYLEILKDRSRTNPLNEIYDDFIKLLNKCEDVNELMNISKLIMECIKIESLNNTSMVKDAINTAQKMHDKAVTRKADIEKERFEHLNELIHNQIQEVFDNIEKASNDGLFEYTAHFPFKEFDLDHEDFRKMTSSIKTELKAQGFRVSVDPLPEYHFLITW